MWLYRLIRIITYILFICGVSTKYLSLDEQVIWTKESQRCSVSPARDTIPPDEIADYSVNSVAWKSSSIYSSNLAEFYGCMDAEINLTATDDKTINTLNSYFPESMLAFKTTNVFKCAYCCTSKGQYFAFVGFFCKCINVTVFQLQPQNTTSCLAGFVDARRNRDPEHVFSSSHHGLPIFRFEESLDLQIRSVSSILNARDNYYCVVTDNDAITLVECLPITSSWYNAINVCLFGKKTIAKTRKNNIKTWLGYFMYIERKQMDETDDSKRWCIASLVNTAQQLTSDRYRNCSNHLAILCKEGTSLSPASTPIDMIQGSIFPVDSNFGRTSKPTSTNTGELLIMNVVLFGLCILVVIMIILRKHFNIQVCKTTTKKCQRNNTNKTEDEMSEGTVPGNERKADRDSYNDPWELRHNIVHMDELYQQEIIDNQMEETET